MPLSVKVGTFAKSTGAAPASQAITGVGFTPSVIIFWSSGGTTTDAWIDSSTETFGFATTTEQLAHARFGFDGTTGTNSFSTGGSTSDAIQFTGINPTPTVIARAASPTMDADGFTLSWTTNNASAYLIHYLALGGTQITGQDISNFGSPAAPGDKVVTGVGFRPELIITSRGIIAAPGSTNYDRGIGAADGTTNWSADSRTFWYTTDSKMYAYATRSSTKIISFPDIFAVEDIAATLSAFDSDGYTINFTNINVSVAWKALTIKGCHVKVGSFNKSVTGAPTDQGVTGVGFTPKALFFVATGTAAGIQSGTGSKIVIGASDGTSHAVTADQSDSNVTPTNIAAVDSSTRAFIRANNSSKTVNAQCVVKTLDSDGFTLTWDINDATATPIGYVAFGAWVTPTATTTIASPVTTVSAQLNGIMNPGGATASFPVSYKFEYGLTAAYGSSTTPVGGQTGSSDIVVMENISGLTPTTLYHFRLVAYNDGETANGLDETFTTYANDPSIMAL